MKTSLYVSSPCRSATANPMDQKASPAAERALGEACFLRTTSCNTHVQDLWQRTLASDMAATRLPSPEDDQCLWEVSRRIVDR